MTQSPLISVSMKAWSQIVLRWSQLFIVYLLKEDTNNKLSFNLNLDTKPVISEHNILCFAFVSCSVL